MYVIGNNCLGYECDSGSFFKLDTVLNLLFLKNHILKGFSSAIDNDFIKLYLFVLNNLIPFLIISKLLHGYLELKIINPLNLLLL